MLNVKILTDTDLHTSYNVYIISSVFIYSLCHQALKHGTGINQQYVCLSCIQVFKCLWSSLGWVVDFATPIIWPSPKGQVQQLLVTCKE